MRIDGRGRIDRGTRLAFRFDGARFEGHPGDTLASALLANGVRLMGRSFKYHRPRGPLTAGPEEPNALVEIGEGAARIPNTRATVQELYEGLTATSQNRLGPLSRDLLAVNDALAPFLGAGFYYKTFMWPRSFWEKLYEPAIRRAAGLGRLSPEPDPARHERAFAHCDLLVIGAGPAGLMAALTAAEGGADVILADDATEPGGRLLSESEEVGGMPGPDWVADMLARTAETGRVRLMTRTTVTGAYDGGVYGALERVGLHLPLDPELPRECFWRITARRAILAAGALERPIAFPSNDRPGILLGSALRSYLHRYGVAAGRRVTVFTSTDEGHRTATDFQAAGVEVAAVVDARDEAQAQGDYRLVAGGVVVGTRGRLALREIAVRTGGTTERIETDCLAVSGGWNPTLHLTCHMNGRPVWDARLAAFGPAEGAVPGLTPAGACNGAFSTAACLREGRDAARHAVSALGGTAPDTPLPEASDDPGRARALWQVEARGGPWARSWLDFANDVTTKDVALAAKENFRSVEHMKRYTTQGMAPDQGRSSNIGALAVLADATGRAIPETGTTTYRPPFQPVTIGAMAAGAEGKGFAPERLTTSHGASIAMEAPMIAAGLWYRPSFFPRPGEKTWRESCDREVGYVRATVGVCDVSTLGKIEIVGPDAGAFLDFVYTNTMSTLKPGRVRYGLMLREDGHVMDDGTCACLGERQFLVTTTTAAAGQVMAHLDFVSQALRPGLAMRFASVTEHWAQFAVAGPRARALLDTILDAPLGELPFMACAPVLVHGVAARLFRISFSGEEGYEIAVPARFGAALFRDLVARAETLRGGAYGMEALNVLRIEKGFITHAEIHGRVTAADVGMGRMMSAKKDFIGKAAAARPGLTDEAARENLVGLRPVDGTGGLLAGAHLFAPDAPAIREASEGYLTSACHSPTLGHALALGFLKNGRARHGEKVRMVDHLRGAATLCEVCDPVFFDPEGGRMRGQAH